MPRAKHWEHWTPPQPSLAEVRRKFAPGISDEELILRVFAGDEPVNALLDGGKPRTAADGNAPLVRLIEDVGKSKRYNHFYISRPGFSLRLERRGNAGG